MKKSVAALLGLLAALISARATVIGQWTFEVNTPADATDSATISGIAADLGNGSASGAHAGATTDWSTPAGNGSANSLSANTWASGDYFQFALSTVGYQGINVTWDQRRSSTAPQFFDFAYSINGSVFTIALDNYSIGTDSWSSATHISTTSYSVDLSSIIPLNGASTIYFRIIADSSASSTAGTSSVDNFTVNGTPMQNSVPDSLPTGLAALALFGMLFLPIGILQRKTV